MPSIQELLQEGSADIVRGSIRKIVEIYDIEWIVLHELIQNSIDAIQVNPRVDKGLVNVIVNLDQDMITVHDNGTGFKFDLGLLQPHGTGSEKRLSSRSPTKGYQGVGLKAVMYSTVSFLLESQTTSKNWIFCSENLRHYIDPSHDFIPEYEIESNDTISDETFTKITAQFPEGTIGQIINSMNRFLGEDTVKWKSLYKQEHENGTKVFHNCLLAHFFSWYFRSQSYVGCVNSLLNIEVYSPTTETLESIKSIDVKLCIHSSSQFSGTNAPLGEWFRSTEENQFEVTIPYRAWDFAEISKSNYQRAAKYRIAPEVVSIKPNTDDWDKLSVSFRDKFLDLKLVPNNQATEFRDKYADIIAILERPRSRVKAEQFQDVLGKILGIYLAIGRTAHFETLGVPNRGLKLIASNGTPTAHELTIRSTSSTWYLETIHFVVNIDSTLNIGKRHMANTRLVGRVRDFFEACYPKLVSISKLFVERDPSGVGDGPPMPEVIAAGKIYRQGIPFRRFPGDEDTLIGLFSSTISRRDPEFRIFGLFRNARYDGKYLWQDTNPKSENDLKLLEFKLELNKLIDEFDLATHDKEFREINLVVVWDRRHNKAGWTVKGISDARRTILEAQGVPTDIVNFVLEDLHGYYSPLICVADLLSEIPLEEGESDDIGEYVTSLG